jgi:hypothetical protein
MTTWALTTPFDSPELYYVSHTLHLCTRHPVYLIQPYCTTYLPTYLPTFFTFDYEAYLEYRAISRLRDQSYDCQHNCIGPDQVARQYL